METNTVTIVENAVTTSHPGRPATELVYPENGAFTVNELFELNKSKVKWALTIRQHIEKGLENGNLKKLKTKPVPGQLGKPPSRYIKTSAWAVPSKGVTIAVNYPMPGILSLNYSAPVVVHDADPDLF
jgi:hypothetical protein